MADIMTVAIAAAREAGSMLALRRGRWGSIEEKGDHSLVTDLDREAERIVCRHIEEHFPDHGIIGEEGALRRSGAEYTWIIDPLDGTHNYIRGLPLYGVSIGVAHRGRHVVGVIYMPAVDALYSAQEGAGAYRNGERIRVSDTDVLSRCSMSFDSRIKRSPRKTLRALAELGPRVFNIRMFGASTVLLTYLAEGGIDFAVEFADQPWDFAGGVCLVREAGGTITALDGGPIGIDSNAYLASNGKVHTPVITILSAIVGEAEVEERQER